MTFAIKSLKELLNTKQSATHGVVMTGGTVSKSRIATPIGVVEATPQGILNTGDKVVLNEGVAARQSDPSLVIPC